MIDDKDRILKKDQILKNVIFESDLEDEDEFVVYLKAFNSVEEEEDLVEEKDLEEKDLVVEEKLKLEEELALYQKYAEETDAINTQNDNLLKQLAGLNKKRLTLQRKLKKDLLALKKPAVGAARPHSNSLSRGYTNEFKEVTRLADKNLRLTKRPKSNESRDARLENRNQKKIV
ncbi:hypothetical protein ACP275_05G112100 [Erythranthe tilingii]